MAFGSALATGLERARLESGRAVVSLGLNPKSLSIRRSTQWQASANRSPSAPPRASASRGKSGGAVPSGHGPQQYLKSQPGTLSMVVWFDQSFEPDGDISDDLDQLQNWTCPTEHITHRVHPPRITFTWGALHY